MERNSKTRLAALWVILPALALGAPACSDDDSGACDNVADACDTLDATACLINTVQTCTANADGCLVWTDTQACGDNATCTGGLCLCANPCTLGASQCSGDLIQLCAEDAEGCTYWAEGTDCSATGESCDDSGAAAECVSGAGCGNDLIEGAEVCDGTDLGGRTCVDEGFGGGTLACNGTCDAYVTTACTAAQTCGNDTAEGTEVCDGADLQSETCVTQGFYSGNLACAANCGSFDTSACVGMCGYDTINGTEVCDGSDLASETCVTQGFYGGNLACNANCTGYDTTGCAGTCGDGAINGTELCDTNDFGGDTCADYGYYTGSLACNGTCDTVITTGCSEHCGDAAINGAEVCDGAALGTATCVTEGFGGGTLACNGTCDGFDTTGCAGAGETCASAYDVTSATFPVSLTGTFEDDPATGFSCDTTPTDVVWYQFTPSTTGVYTFDATNTNASAYARLAVFDGTACAPYDTELFCVGVDDVSVNGSAYLTAGSTYLIAFFTDGDLWNMVDPSISVSFTTANAGDTCGAPIDISAVSFPYQVSDTFDVDASNGFSCDSSPTNVVWYQYTAAASGTYEISATNATTTFAYSRLVVLDGTGCTPYATEIDCVTNASETASTTVTFTAGSTYLIGFFTDGAEYTMVDPTITVTRSFNVGWCNLQWPLTITAIEDATEMTYGRVYIAGLTDLTNGPDTHPAVLAEVGVGPDGTDPSVDPSQWTWYPAVANPGFPHASNDEYMGALTVPASAGSPYDYAYRFSGNSGISWTYCDRTDNSYDVSDAGDLVSNPQTGTLIISEYIEGSSNNKALELYNATGINYNLANCDVMLFSNGSATPTATYSFPTLYLAPGGVHVLCHGSANATLSPYCDAFSSSLVNFNGDDALELVCGGVLVDSIGQVGVDPGSNWGSGATSTANATLRRNAGIMFGDTDSSDAYDPAAQWTGYAIDTFDGLGTHP